MSEPYPEKKSVIPEGFFIDTNPDAVVEMAELCEIVDAWLREQDEDGPEV